MQRVDKEIICDLSAGWHPDCHCSGQRMSAHEIGLKRVSNLLRSLDGCLRTKQKCRGTRQHVLVLPPQTSSGQSMSYYRARSVGSRILAAGLLPLPQLRCSSRQGLRKLTHDRPGSAAFQCSTSKGRIPIVATATFRSVFRLYLRTPEKNLLQRVSEISHAVSQVVRSGTTELFFDFSAAAYARTGAEGQQ